jgi:hypothetical protein
MLKEIVFAGNRTKNLANTVCLQDAQCNSYTVGATMADLRRVSLVNLSALVLVGFLILQLLIPISIAEESEQVTEQKFSWKNVMEGWREAQQQRKPLLIYVSMPQCAYCRKLEREAFAESRLQELIKTRFVAVQAVADRDIELIQRWGIRVYPTVLVISPENKIAWSAVGYKEPGSLYEELLTLTTAQSASAEGSVRH